MSGYDIAIIIAFIVMIVLIIEKCYNKYNNEKNNKTNLYESYNNDKTNNETNFYELNDNNNYDDLFKKLSKNNKHEPLVNPYFLENQFHDDYRDILNTFNILDPIKKQTFNQAELPLINTEIPNNKETIQLVKNFIKTVNKVNKTEVKNELGMTNWNDNMPADPAFESGWDKHMKKLGLPPSLYNAPASKANIKLIKIDHSEKFETEYEINYITYIIVQKLNTDVQMVIRVSYIIDKSDINLDREFFDKSKSDHKTQIKLETISVIGFMTNHNFGSSEQVKREKYYDFGKITDGRMFSQKDIITMLNKKRRENTQGYYNL